MNENAEKTGTESTKAVSPAGDCCRSSIMFL